MNQKNKGTLIILGILVVYGMIYYAILNKVPETFEYKAVLRIAIIGITFFLCFVIYKKFFINKDK